MSVVYFRGTRAEAVAIVRQIKDALTGKVSDPTGLARGVFNAIGLKLLSEIKDDFIRKSEGGTGEDGVKWPPLSKKYLAYGKRFAKGEQVALKTGAGLGKGHRHGIGTNTGLLSASEKKLWNKIFGSRLQRLLLSLPPAEAKARAAQIAWAELKRMGAKTKIDVFGSRKAPMLRDWGMLFNSISPGEITGTDYIPPSKPGGEHQIFSTIANGIIVGTNVPYASVHQHGSPSQGIPARPFLPKTIPAVWQQRINVVATQAIAIAVRMALDSRG